MMDRLTDKQLGYIRVALSEMMLEEDYDSGDQTEHAEVCEMAGWGMNELQAYRRSGLTPEQAQALHSMLKRWGMANWSIEEMDKWRDRMLWHVERCNEYDFIPRSGIPLDRLKEFVQADQERRVILLRGQHTTKDGEEALRKTMYIVGVTNNAANRFVADAVAEKLVRDERNDLGSERIEAMAAEPERVTRERDAAVRGDGARGWEAE